MPEISPQISQTEIAKRSRWPLRKILATGAVGLALFGMTEAKARADSGGYPYADAADVHPGPPNYEWGYTECKPEVGARGYCSTNIEYKDGIKYYGSDPWNYVVRNCTSYVAWRVKKEFGVDLPDWHDGQYWDTNAHASGYKVSGIDADKKGPEAGDIAEWDSNHVAFVDSVNPDGSVNISEYNYDFQGHFHQRGEAYNGLKVVADHYIDINGVGNILNGASANNDSGSSYWMVGEDQQLTDGNWVYRKEGGSAWPIKLKSQWTDSDTQYWGGTPASVPTTQIHDHEVGYDQNGRSYGAHPPTDGTAVEIDGGNGDVYDFVGGHAFYIGSMAELAILGINQVKRIPATGDRLSDFLDNPLRLASGSMYRFADTPTVRLYAQQPDGSNPAMIVQNETSLDCFESVQAKHLLMLPDSAQQYLSGQNGLPIYESSIPAGCSYPGSWAESAPGNQDQWYIAGDGSTSPYQRHYYPNLLSLYVDTGGSPVFHTMRSAEALTNIPQGSNMYTNPHSFFRNASSGNIYWWGDDQVAHKILSMDSLSCMGGPAYINVPAEALVRVPEGTAAQCALEGKLARDTANGSIWYIKNGQRDYVLSMNIVYGLEGRVASTQGRLTDASDAIVTSYNQGPNAWVPYGPPVFLKYSGDSSIWLVLPDGTRRHAMSLCSGIGFLTVPTGEFDGHVNTGNWSANSTDCYKIANGQMIG